MVISTLDQNSSLKLGSSGQLCWVCNIWWQIIGQQALATTVELFYGLFLPPLTMVDLDLVELTEQEDFIEGNAMQQLS